MGEKIKKTKPVLIFPLLLFFVTVPYVSADQMGVAVAKATVEVIPTISVESDPIGMDMGSVQTGLFSGIFTFRIDSNFQYVLIQISASHLYKAGWPGEVPPISLALDEGVEIHPDVSRPNTAVYETDTLVGDLPGAQFSMVPFESNQDGRFSSDIDVIVSWNQDSTCKPKGNYSGYVKLYAIINMTPP